MNKSGPLFTQMRSNRARWQPNKKDAESEYVEKMRQEFFCRANSVSASVGIDPPHKDAVNYGLCMRIAATVRNQAAERKRLPWWRVERWWW